MGNVIVCIAKSIKVLCAYRDLNITQLGYKLGLSKENFHAQIKRDNFRINDIVKIADTLGYDVNIQFVDQVNGRVVEVEREDVSANQTPPIVKTSKLAQPAPSYSNKVNPVPIPVQIPVPPPIATPTQISTPQSVPTREENFETNFDNWKSKYEQITDIPSPKNLIPLNYKTDEEPSPFTWKNE